MGFGCVWRAGNGVREGVDEEGEIEERYESRGTHLEGLRL